MLRLNPAWLLALAAPLYLGCGGRHHLDTTDDTTVAQPITFRLTFESDLVDDRIFVQESDGAASPAWLSLWREGDGAKVPYHIDCGNCACSECGQCAVCGMGQPVVTAIARGAAVEFTWTGLTQQPSTCPGSGFSCREPTPLEPGSYRARFCYSTQATGEGSGHEIGPATCAEEAFAYPVPGGKVQHDVCFCG